MSTADKLGTQEAKTSASMVLLRHCDLVTSYGDMGLWSILVQVMACCLTTLPVPVLTWHS